LKEYGKTPVRLFNDIMALIRIPEPEEDSSEHEEEETQEEQVNIITPTYRKSYPLFRNFNIIFSA